MAHFGSDYEPRHEWNCQTVSRPGWEPTGKRAHFEAYPNDPKTFLRGEGDTERDAEDAAWAELLRYRACEGHEYTSRDPWGGRYWNGGGFCIHCKMFACDVFSSLESPVTCAYCGTPTDFLMVEDPDKSFAFTHVCQSCLCHIPERLYAAAIDAALWRYGTLTPEGEAALTTECGRVMLRIAGALKEEGAPDGS